jgi:hypothetical protein
MGCEKTTSQHLFLTKPPQADAFTLKNKDGSNSTKALALIASSIALNKTSIFECLSNLWVITILE